MKKIKKKTILWCTGVLILTLVCGLTLYCLATAYERKVNAKEFVEYLIQYADEASGDFEDCGFAFSVTEGGGIRIDMDAGMLIVTDADGWKFYYQASKKYGDQLAIIEGRVETVKGERLTGSLRIEERGKGYAYVEVEHGMEDFRWIRETYPLVYRTPEFDEYQKRFKDEEIAYGISKWISNEELSALYKKGKALEEILSAYCELKRHNVDISIHSYEPEYMNDYEGDDDIGQENSGWYTVLHDEMRKSYMQCRKSIRTNFYCRFFEGTWEVKAYVDSAVESTGAEWEDEAEYNEYVKKSSNYIGIQFVLGKENITERAPGGFVFDSYEDLFASVRQPPTLGITPPFVGDMISTDEWEQGIHAEYIY